MAISSKWLHSIFAITILYNSSCAERKIHKTPTQNIILDPISVSAKSKTLTYQAIAPQEWDICHTQVSLKFNLEKKQAYSKEILSITPHFYPTDSIVLDAKSMTIDSILLVNSTNKYKIQSHTYNDSVLTIKFNTNVEATDTVKLCFYYTTNTYAHTVGGSKAITADRGLYFINTDSSIAYKPMQIWTQGETEANSNWLITLDKPNFKTTLSIDLTVPSYFTTLSNGLLSKQADNKDGTRTDYWTMQQPIPVYTIMFATGVFSTTKEKWNNKEVSYYTEPKYSQYATTIFSNTLKMLDYYSSITGVAYPWPKYSQIVVRDYVSGAMENTSASLFGAFMNGDSRLLSDKPDNELVVAHELFHQWFGDYATAKSWSNLTVNESFANYGEYLWLLHQYGKDAADIHIWNSLQRYLFRRPENNTPLVRYYYEDKEEMFDAITYNKGGAILHYLQYIIGDEAFYKAMQDYLTTNAYKSTEATDWHKSVEKVTGKDYKWFFNEFYFQGGHPKIDIQYLPSDSLQQLKICIAQDSTNTYILPLTLEIIRAADNEMMAYTLKRQKDTIIIHYKQNNAPTVVFDATHVIPGTINETKTIKDYYQQYTGSKSVISRLLAVKYLQKAKTDSITNALLLKALNDKNETIKETAIKLLNKRQNKPSKEILQILEYIAREDNSSKCRVAAIRILNDNKPDSYKDLLLKLVYDSSYAVAGEAIQNLWAVDSNVAYPLAKHALENNPAGALATNAYEIIGLAAKAADTAIYQTILPYKYQLTTEDYLNSISEYLENINNLPAYKIALASYAQYCTTEEVTIQKKGYLTALFDVKEKIKNSSTTYKTEKLNLLNSTFESMIQNARMSEHKEYLQQQLATYKHDK